MRVHRTLSLVTPSPPPSIKLPCIPLLLSPIRVVIGVVVAKSGGGMVAVEVVVRNGAVAAGGHSLLGAVELAKVVHGSGIGPGCVVDSVIAEHATPTYHEVVSRAVGPQEAVSLEVVGVHEPVALVDVI